MHNMKVINNFYSIPSIVFSTLSGRNLTLAFWLFSDGLRLASVVETAEALPLKLRRKKREVKGKEGKEVGEKGIEFEERDVDVY